MFSAEALRDLFRHMEWADATVWAAALGTARAADDTTLRNDLLHLHGVQQAWLAMWSGRPPGAAFPKVDCSHPRRADRKDAKGLGHTAREMRLEDPVPADRQISDGEEPVQPGARVRRQPGVSSLRALV